MRNIICFEFTPYVSVQCALWLLIKIIEVFALLRSATWGSLKMGISIYKCMYISKLKSINDRIQILYLGSVRRGKIQISYLGSV